MHKRIFLFIVVLALIADGGASIFTAIEEQLGLRLESRKTASSVIVVDSADRLLPD